MGTRPKSASKSTGVFHSRYLRSAVLLLLIFSLLPSVAFAWAPGPAAATQDPAASASALNTEGADFIMGPQAPIGNSWFDVKEIERAKVHGAACPATPPPLSDWQALDAFVMLQYYDLPLNEYIAYRRTGDPVFLAYAQKCADAWWQHPSWIKQGTQRDFDNGATPPPRHGGIGGLILRAMDGRPEMWDWINQYTKFHLGLWLKQRINDPQLYYGVREGAFALHHAIWLAKVLPDSFPLQAGGMETNGAAIRAQYLADAEAITTQYF